MINLLTVWRRCVASLFLALVTSAAIPEVSVAQALPELSLRSGGVILLATNRQKQIAGAARSSKNFSANRSNHLVLARITQAGPRTSQESDIRLDELAEQGRGDGLERAIPDGESQLLLYVHGFNNSVESAVSLAADVANKMRFGGNLMVFSWPSQASLLAYSEDIRSADSSTAELVGLLRRLRGSTKVSRVHVLAHSLGNEPLTKALVELLPEFRGSGKLGELILCSPDVGRDVFIGRVRQIVQVARGTTLWVSDSDIALDFARLLGRGVRAGQVPTDLGPIVVSGMDTIDVSRETRLFARNHNAYSQVDALFADLAQVLAASASRPWLDPARAGNYLRKTTQAGPYWYYMQ